MDWLAAAYFKYKPPERAAVKSRPANDPGNMSELLAMFGNPQAGNVVGF